MWHIYTMRPFVCTNFMKMCVRMHECIYIHIHSISAIIMVNFFFPLFHCSCAMTQQWRELQRHKRKREAIAKKNFFLFYYSSSDYANIWLIFFIPFTEWPIKNCNRVEKEHKRSITFSCLCIDERTSEWANNKKCEWLLKC